MRDWLLVFVPLGVVVYFLVFPDQFVAFMGWATQIFG